MATNVEALLAWAAAPLERSTTGTLAQEMERLTGQLPQLRTMNQVGLESVRTNTQIVKAAMPMASSGSSGSSMGGTILSVLGTGLGLSPLISGIAKLFGGGGAVSELPPVMKFALRESQSVSAFLGAGMPGALAVDHAQGGSPRAVAASAPTGASQNITVHVQTMDSRSFLDHSHEIAMAVRQAMLESNVLNDVVREA